MLSKTFLPIYKNMKNENELKMILDISNILELYEIMLSRNRAVSNFTCSKYYLEA